MRLLLPPSEAKNPGGRGRPLRDRLDGPLGAARAEIAEAVSTLAAGDPGLAAAALRLPPGVAVEALTANARVLDARTLPALRRYAGVVYEALGYEAMPPTHQKIARASVLIFSGLLGVTGGAEPTPLYRVPATAVLPRVGVAATYWRPRLAATLDAIAHECVRRGRCVVDLRSSDYAAMWRPRREVRDHVIDVRVLSPLARGGVGVVSYVSKHAKGRLAAALIARVADGDAIAGTDDIARVWARIGGAGAEPRGTGLDLITS